MSKRSNRDAAARAEARRRARLAAQGRMPEEDAESTQAQTATGQPSAGFLQRFFPPAPPLPGKPDPLRDFKYAGRYRRLAENLWLLRQNPVASIGMGALWAFTVILAPRLGASVAGTILSFGSLGALLAAGWLGWQRPWLFGLVAGLIGALIYAPYFVIVILTTPPPLGVRPTPFEMAIVLLATAAQYGAIGIASGYYAGYLRRRMADQTLRRAAPPARRR